MGKYVLSKSSNNQYYWNLKSTGNTETLLTSETYTTKQNALNGIASSKVSVGDANFVKKTGFGNQPYYFTQIASNGQTLGKSEMYSTSAGRDNGIAAVKRDAPSATIEDLT